MFAHFSDSLHTIMVKLAIVALAALCLAAAAGGQLTDQLPWGGLVEEVAGDAAGDGRQAATTTSTLSTLLANLISNVVAPLLQNVATGVTNAITATFANRTLRYIPVPVPYVVEPTYRVPPRPYDDYPTFYKEPSSRPAPAAELYRRLPADSPELN